MKSCQLMAICICAGVMSVASAQTPEERRLAPVGAVALNAGEAVKIDGKLDEAIWQRAVPVKDFFETRPRDGVAATLSSEVRIAYDKHSLYIALTAHDPDPSRIEAPLLRRDQTSGAQDFFQIYIDPAGSRKFAQIFRINASGAIGDGLFSEDTGNDDFSPDFEFESHTARGPTGWTAELRIPFSTLRYSDPPSENWSILVFRGANRDQEYRFVNARMPRSANCTLCYAQSVTGMRDLPHGREFTVTPQMTLRRTGERLNSEARKTHNDYVFGTDIKFRPRADLVFDATINPDFSQVELDTPQLAANAQFALFFPEKRPFFLEGSDLFNTPLNTIYTRSITNPAWGARITRRNQGADFTFLTVRDDGGGLILLPGAVNTGFALQNTKSQATIGRFRWQPEDKDLSNWSFGGLITDRTYEKAPGIPKAYNRVLGADFVWRPNGELRVRGQVLTSDTSDLRNPRPDGTPNKDQAGIVDYNFRDAKWNLSGGLEYSGRGFRADNGFYNQAGYINVYQNVQRKWTDVGPFIEVAPFINGQRINDYDGRMVWQNSAAGVYLLAAKSTGMVFEIRPDNMLRFRSDGPTLKRDQFYFNLESTPGTWLSSYFIEGSIGDQGDVANNRMRRGYFISANAKIRMFGRFELEPQISESVVGTHVRPGATELVLRERAVQIASVYHFTDRDNIRLVAQHNHVRRGVSYYATPVSAREKTETVSLVYGHRAGLGTNIYFGATVSKSSDPGAAFPRNLSEVFIKASWAFDLAGLIS